MSKIDVLDYIVTRNLHVVRKELLNETETRGNKLKEHVNKKTNEKKINWHLNSHTLIHMKTFYYKQWTLLSFCKIYIFFLQREKVSIKQDLNCHLSQMKDPDKIYLETYIQDF